MKKDNVNLADTIKLFKKNIISFYLSILIGLIVGLIGVFININYLEKKTDLYSKISIKNPLQNYSVLDLFSLDAIKIDDDRGVSIASTREKINNYEIITKEYMELVIDNLDLNKYDINPEKYGYKIKTEKKENELEYMISDVKNPSEVEENMKRMVSDFNSLIKPIILENIITENNTIENYMAKISEDNSYTKKLSILIKIRKENISNLKKQSFEIFDLTSYQKTQKVSNLSIISVSILVAFSIFLMLIILRK